jgi:hypothetical protein
MKFSSKQIIFSTEVRTCAPNYNALAAKQIMSINRRDFWLGVNIGETAVLPVHRKTQVRCTGTPDDDERK